MNTHLHVLTEEVVRDLLIKVASDESQKAIKATQEASEDSGRFKMLITSQAVDRDNEVILTDGWEVEDYMKNPVVMLFHRLDMLPVGITETLTKTEQGYVAEGRFAPADANPIAQQVRKLYDLGIMRAASVGFMVKQRDRANPSVIVKAALYEWSFVPVPSNPDALSLLEANGFDVKELVSKGFLTEVKGDVEMKMTEPVETKGQIEDTLVAHGEMMEAKWNKMMYFWHEVYKFSDAYYSDATPVEDFDKLLGELTTNLQALKPTDGEVEMSDDMKAFMAQAKSRFAVENKEVETEEKAGRTISKKTRAILQAAHDATTQASETLSKLLEVADGAEGSDDDGSEEEKVIDPALEEELKTLREQEAVTKNLLRSIVTSLNSTLSKKK